MYDLDTIQRAKAALKRPGGPGDFGYHGDLPLFETWGLCGPAQTRDSDALEKSNFAVVSEDLLERFPEDVQVEHFGHWAVGWADQFAVRVLANDYQPAMPADWKLTDAFLAVLEWEDRLAEYPVADEEHWSQLEMEEFVEWLETLRCPEENGIEYEPAREDWASELASALSEEYAACRPDDCPDEEEILSLGIRKGIFRPELDSAMERVRHADEDIAELTAILETVAELAADIDRGIFSQAELRTYLAEKLERTNERMGV